MVTELKNNEIMDSTKKGREGFRIRSLFTLFHFLVQMFTVGTDMAFSRLSIVVKEEAGEGIYICNERWDVRKKRKRRALSRLP